MEAEEKDGATAFELAHYREAQVLEPDAERHPELSPYTASEVELPLLALEDPVPKRRRRIWTLWSFKRRRIWTPWIVIPFFIVSLIISYHAGKGSVPEIPNWIKDRIPKLSKLDDFLEDKLGSSPTQRPYSNAVESTRIDLPHSCQFIPRETFETLNSVQEPLIRIVAQNESVTAFTRLTAPISVCVLVSVPQHEFRNGSYPDAPVPGKGPDTIHMYLNSSDVIVTFPPLIPLPDQPHAFDQFSPRNIIYSVETSIFNAGDYVVTADIEFSNWRWAQEWHVEGYDWTTVTGEPAGDMVEEHKYQPISLPAATFAVDGSRHLPSRPLCDNTTNAGQGRWYRYRSFPVLDRDLVDEWGYTWQGDDCHLDFFSAIDCLDCLANKTIHIYGDSMMRRLAKTILSGGKWCLDPYARCQDEDDKLKGQIPKLDVDADGGIVVDEFLREEHFQRYDVSSITFGKNTTIYFSFITALAGSSGTWMEPLYDEKDRFLLPGAGEKLAPDAMDTRPGAVARPPPDMAPADLVLLGFGAWDQAFTDRFNQYEAQLQRLRDAFLQAYSDVPIVMRMSNQWCCRGTHQLFRRYTGSRIHEFDSRTRKVFQVEGGTAMGGRIRVMDPANMNGRPDVIHDYRPSNANHPRASHVRIEMQMMMNNLCSRNDNGRAEFNGYVPS